MFRMLMAVLQCVHVQYEMVITFLQCVQYETVIIFLQCVQYEMVITFLQCVHQDMVILVIQLDCYSVFSRKKYSRD